MLKFEIVAWTWKSHLQSYHYIDLANNQPTKQTNNLRIGLFHIKLTQSQIELQTQ